MVELSDIDRLLSEAAERQNRQHVMPDSQRINAGLAGAHAAVDENEEGERWDGQS